jgi:hypothetical protein
MRRGEIESNERAHGRRHECRARGRAKTQVASQVHACMLGGMFYRASAEPAGPVGGPGGGAPGVPFPRVRRLAPVRDYYRPYRPA